MVIMIMMIVLMCCLINTCPCNDLVSYNEDDMTKIKSIIDTKVNACNTVYIITVTYVTNDVTHLIIIIVSSICSLSIVQHIPFLDQ